MRFSGFSFRLGKRTRLYFHNDKKRAEAKSTASAAPAAQGEPAFKSSRTTGGVLLRILVIMWGAMLIESTYTRGDLVPFIIAIAIFVAAFAWLLNYLRTTAQKDADEIERLEREKQAKAEFAAKLEQERIERERREAQERADTAAKAQRAREEAAANAAREHEELAARLERERPVCAAKREQERAEREAAHQEWLKTHGVLTTKVSGVTFKNADGSSRQAYLKEIEASGASKIGFEEFDYQGAPSFRVTADGMEIGTIPADVVPELIDIMPRVEKVDLSVDSFSPDDSRRRVYRADISIIYSKEPAETEN